MLAILSHAIEIGDAAAIRGRFPTQRQGINHHRGD
jgi:hypothetical protein